MILTELRVNGKWISNRERRTRINKICPSVPATVLAGLIMMGCSDDNSSSEMPDEDDPSPVAVGDGTFDNTEALTERVSTLTSRDQEPVASDDAVTSVSLAQRQFALDMHRALAADQPVENLVFSPYSMSTALSMTLGGTAGSSNSQLANLLHLDGVSEVELHQAVNRLDLAVMAGTDAVAIEDAVVTGDGDQPDAMNRAVPEEETTEALQLISSNRLFVAQGANLQDDYLDLVMGQYGAPLTEADFVNQSEEVTAQINGWVSARTRGRIEQLVDDIDPQTKAILVNALLLAADWTEPYEFFESRTFSTLDGPIDGPAFGGEVRENSLVEDNLQAIEMLYEGEQLSLVLIHPSDLASYEQGFDEVELQRVLDQMQSRAINLSVPTWSSEYDTDARELLVSLGMPDGAMDFSAMLNTPGSTELAISKVRHAAAIEVDEFGTVAAAGTAVDVGVGSAPGGGGPTRITVDSPFLYVIMDRVNGVILFSGRVTDPRG